MERILRYVELNASGKPIHEATAAWFDGPTVEEAYAQLVIDAAHNGNTVVRLKDSRYARNPNLDDIEGDGEGGIRAKAGKRDALKDVEVLK